ncbi:MAG: hypothetical protein JJT76_11710 [Clostridiaceae bacterium]|nr:hypothetical protein [Clostridiaceae bacterium]
MIKVICPASCGELIQGYIEEGEKLISYSIDLFTEVTIKEESHNVEKIPGYHKKAYEMMKKVFQHYGYDKNDYASIKLDINSPIPTAKGMASSTADLAATALATSKYLKKHLLEEDIAKLCIAIEPTDSTVFSEVTLFDHLKGSYKKNYGNLSSCRVLILEGKDLINTIEFRKKDYSIILKKNQPILKKAITLFEEGIKNQDLKTIGSAATLSGFANQSILHKEGLEELHEVSQRLGAYGINVAHSGSVVGILYNDKYFDKEAFIHSIKKEKYINKYLSIKSYNIIPGGAREV